MTAQIEDFGDGLVVGRETPVGRFVYSVPDDHWWWSDTMFGIHGFEPGEIPPTTAVLQAHKHPDDQAHTSEVLARAIATGQPFSCYHRIIDSRRRVRHVVAVADAVLGGNGQVVELRGYLVDLTDSRRRDMAEETAAAVRGATESRALIEQAKGVLMFVYGLDAETAFALLSARSQENNVKVRDLAARITSAGRAGPTYFPYAQRRLTDILDPRPDQGCGDSLSSPTSSRRATS